MNYQITPSQCLLRWGFLGHPTHLAPALPLSRPAPSHHSTSTPSMLTPKGPPREVLLSPLGPKSWPSYALLPCSSVWKMPSLSSPRLVFPWTDGRGECGKPITYSLVDVCHVQTGGWCSIPPLVTWALEFPPLSSPVGTNSHPDHPLACWDEQHLFPLGSFHGASLRTDNPGSNSLCSPSLPPHAHQTTPSRLCTEQTTGWRTCQHANLQLYHPSYRGSRQS